MISDDHPTWRPFFLLSFSRKQHQASVNRVGRSRNATMGEVRGAWFVTGDWSTLLRGLWRWGKAEKRATGRGRQQMPQMCPIVDAQIIRGKSTTANTLKRDAQERGFEAKRWGTSEGKPRAGCCCTCDCDGARRMLPEGGKDLAHDDTTVVLLHAWA